jgi:hypothetical protein
VLGIDIPNKQAKAFPSPYIFESIQLVMASERRLLSVATTIPVSNVQALAARSADELPAETLGRYIRPGQDAVLQEHSDELPVVDLGRLLNPESWEQEAAKLKFACEEWGFFQVYMLPKNQNYCQCSAVSFILSIYSLTAKLKPILCAIHIHLGMSTVSGAHF